MTPRVPATESRRVEIQGDLPKQEQEVAEREIAKLESYVGRPFEWARLTVRKGPGRSKRPYLVDAAVQFGDRFLAAHASGPSPREAMDEAIDRLRRQVRRVKDKDVALRNEFDRRQRPEASLKPPEQRQIVHRRTYSAVPKSTHEAVEDLLDIDVEFFLFKHEETGEEVVVYRRDDGRIGLLHPPNSPLKDENDAVVPEESRYSHPLTLEQAKTEMDFLNHRFLYFIDAADGRGKVLYLRHDGDYGLVEPA